MSDTGEGQATVEAALALPVALLALVLVVEVGVVVRDALALGVAAREGARAVAIDGTDAAAEAAVERSAGPLDPREVEIAVEPAPDERRRGEPVTVRLGYTRTVRIPLVSRFVDTELPLTAEVTMRLERDPP